MRFAFYISGKSGRLSKFLDQDNQVINGEIKLVVSDAIVEKELEHKISKCNIVLETIDDSGLIGTRKEKNRTISDFILTKLNANDIDYCFSFGSHILSGELLDVYKTRIINFHPAILPMFPGVKAIDQAVSHGNVLLIGNTVHFVDSGVDTGPIIMQSVVPLKAFTDTGNYDVVLDLQIDMLNKLIDIIDHRSLCIVDGKPFIDGADYTKSMIFPRF